WLHLQGLDPNSVDDDLKKVPDFLQRLVLETFRSERRKHLAAIAFSSDTEVAVKIEILGWYHPLAKYEDSIIPSVSLVKFLFLHHLSICSPKTYSENQHAQRSMQGCAAEPGRPIAQAGSLHGPRIGGAALKRCALSGKHAPPFTPPQGGGPCGSALPPT